MKKKIIIFLYLLASCSQKNLEENIVKPTLDLRANILSQLHPNQYSVVIHWDLNDKGFTLKRSDKRGLISLCETPECQNPWMDSDVIPGTQVEYFFEKDGEVPFQTSIRIPEDLVVEGEVKLKNSRELSSYNKIFLKANSKLITQGEFNLHLEEINSENGTIETYEESTPAQSGNGKSVGNSYLFSKKARGHLTLISRGEKGANGNKGRSGLMGPRGENGKSAILLRCTDKNPRPKNCNPLIFDLEGKGIIPDDSIDWKINYQCLSSGENGKSGGIGWPGYPGENGMDGGNTGKVFVEIEAPIDFKMDLFQIGGKGGDGGEGGDGGPGGIGGEPGKQDIHQICEAGKMNGPLGPQGPKGPIGNPGRPGLSEALHCLKIGLETFGNCER